MKEKILKATARLIAKNGVLAASTRAICAETKVTAPTLYHYFRDKSVLLDAVTAHAFDKHLKRIHLGKKEATPAEELRRAWNAYMEFVVAEPELYSVMMEAVYRGRVTEAGKACMADLEARFAAPGLRCQLLHSPQVSARMYLAAAQGIAGLSLARGISGEVLHHTEMRETILKALLKQKAAAL